MAVSCARAAFGELTSFRRCCRLGQIPRHRLLNPAPRHLVRDSTGVRSLSHRYHVGLLQRLDERPMASTHVRKISEDSFSMGHNKCRFIDHQCRLSLRFQPSSFPFVDRPALCSRTMGIVQFSIAVLIRFMSEYLSRVVRLVHCPSPTPYGAGDLGHWPYVVRLERFGPS